MKRFFVPLIAVAFFTSSCDQIKNRDTQLGQSWTWMKGSSSPGQAGTYGTKGTASSSNTPGARARGATWTDNSGNLLLFGGYGLSSARTESDLGDFWKYDGENWTWMNGSSTGSQPGSYGTLGIKSSTSIPGSRAGAAFTKDSNGNLYLFGGMGHDGGLNYGRLNDLWKFDGTYWIWISGSLHADEISSDTVPGAREDANLWADSRGNLWLFGGLGRDKIGTVGELNDLWKFDGSVWTFIKGSPASGQNGVYGTQGTPGFSNTPGGRHGAVSWIDSRDQLYLIGGQGFAAGSSKGYLNDVWKFDGAQWAYLSGATGVNPPTLYSGITLPGGRSHSATWYVYGNLLLFGGAGFGEAVTEGTSTSASFGQMADLWKFSNGTWNFTAGSKTPGLAGEYSLQGISTGSGFPGGRMQAMTWVKNNETLYLFGGSGVAANSSGLLNDLWRN